MDNILAYVCQCVNVFKSLWSALDAQTRAENTMRNEKSKQIRCKNAIKVK